MYLVGWFLSIRVAPSNLDNRLKLQIKVMAYSKYIWL